MELKIKAGIDTFFPMNQNRLYKRKIKTIHFDKRGKTSGLN